MKAIPVLSALKSERLDSYSPKVPLTRKVSIMRANGKNNKVLRKSLAEP